MALHYLFLQRYATTTTATNITVYVSTRSTLLPLLLLSHIYLTTHPSTYIGVVVLPQSPTTPRHYHTPAEAPDAYAGGAAEGRVRRGGGQ